MIVKTMILSTLVIAIGYQTYILAHKVIPVGFTRTVEQKLEYLGAPKEVIPAIARAVKKSECPEIDDNIIIALMHSESGFDLRARSSKNYRGAMQIPYNIWYPDANIIVGVDILREKLALTKGNMIEAIVLYKGFRDNRKRGLELANKVVHISQTLRRKFDNV